MRKAFILVLLLAAAAWAANVKLYLKDGSYHVVREYQVQADRVRFYSVERSEWEEIPLDLVDLKRTEAEAAARQTQLQREEKMIAAEEKAEREVEREVSKIPRDPGVYWVEAGQTKILKQAESSVHTNKGRSVLKRLAPIPIVSGKATLEIEGSHSASEFTNSSPEFYLQLSALEQFGIARLTPKGSIRIVENLTILPVTNETEEAPVMIPVLQRELGEGLYKIWPKEPLTEGEYAVVQFTPGKVNMQVWDFAIKRAR
jgi:hypothetical protein